MPVTSAKEVGRRRPLARRKPLSPKISIVIPVAVAAIILVLAGGGFAFAATQEENNSFCASCHTQPESTFYQRFQTAAPVDLASSHMLLQQNPVRCIDCHSGQGITGRISAMLVGARNAAAWFSGTAVQPAPLTVPIGDANCLKCHSAVTGQTQRSNHFHGFLARWQAADPNAANCVSCHASHTTGGQADQVFLDVNITQQVCDACHQVLREGG